MIVLEPYTDQIESPVPRGMCVNSFSIYIPDKKTSYNYERSVAQQPDLTRVCRQIRAETLPMFYGNNQFVLDGDYHDTRYRKWLRIIGHKNAALLRTVTLCLGKKPDRPAWLRQTIDRAKATLPWLKSELGQHAKINVAWFQHYAPYFEDVDVSDSEPV